MAYKNKMKKMKGKKGGMINSDYSAQANLPQGVIMSMYPYVGPNGPEDLSDSDNIRGIDYQLKQDGRLKKRGAYMRRW